jgi:hypothetical protein
MNEGIMTTIKLSPQEAQKLHSEKYVLKWINKVLHRDGEPRLREYEIIGER